MLELVNQRRGLFVKLPTVDVIDLTASSGFDFVVVDLEHSPLDQGHAIALVRHARTIDFPALVRLPTVDPGLVNRLLEAGAAGIQLSMVKSVAQVRKLREAMLYAPFGSRSISLAHPAAGYGSMPLPEYLEKAEAQRPLLVAQFETEHTDDVLADILAAGVDVAFIGLTDLSVDVELDQQRVCARVEEIAEAAQSCGVALGAFGLDDPRVVYRLVSSDLALLKGAVANAA